MNLGDSAHDASRSRPDDASPPAAAAGDGSDKPARSPRTQEALQDIQDLVDKLAAVTRQLGRHDRGVSGPVALAPEAPQQAEAARGAKRGGTEQGEGPDVPGDVRLALQVDAAR